jgi:outer membrane lipoprotein-sorting protein
MRRSVRWAVPAGVVAAIGLAAAAPGASADLPAKTPQEVLVLAQQGDLEAFSGTVVVRTELGVPTALLDAAGGQGSGGPPDQGERTVRVWKDGQERQRVSVSSLMGERTLVRNGDQVWAWDSSTATATTVALPEPDGSAQQPPWLSEGPVDPAEAARWLLDTLGPTTAVSAGEPTVVAGREAYELVLTPTQPGTLVGRAALAVDAATGAVLRVQVSAVGAGQPALDVGYTSFEPTPPPADVFAFSPPPGSTVDQAQVPAAPWGGPADTSAQDRPQVVGEGWTTVVVAPATSGAAEQAAAELPPGVARPVAGGQVVTTALLSVLLTDDGRLLVGAVTPEVLVAAAGG